MKVSSITAVAAGLGVAVSAAAVKPVVERRMKWPPASEHFSIRCPGLYYADGNVSEKMTSALG
jgi:hypothetical protein